MGMKATPITLSDMNAVVQRLRDAVGSDLPLEKLSWLMPLDFAPGTTELHGVPVRRATGLDRPYLVHSIGAAPHESAPIGDPTSPETAYDVVARAMEKWIEKHYTVDFYPDGRRGARDVVQALLDLGWQPPAEVGDAEINLHIRDNGGPGNGLVITVDKAEQFIPLAKRNEKVTVGDIRRIVAAGAAKANRS